MEDLWKSNEWAYAIGSKVAFTLSANLVWQIHTRRICGLLWANLTPKGFICKAYRALTEWTVVTPLWDVWATLDWAKLWYRRKWHDWKHGMFTTAGLSNTEIRGLCAVVEVLLNSIKRKVCVMSFLWIALCWFSKYFVVWSFTTLRNEYFSTRNRESCVVFCICNFTTLLLS